MSNEQLTRKDPLIGGGLNFFLPGFGLGYALPHPAYLLANLATTLLLLQHYYDEYGLFAWFVLSMGNFALAFIVTMVFCSGAVDPSALEPSPATQEVPKSPVLAAWFNAALPGFGLSYISNDSLLIVPTLFVSVVVYLAIAPFVAKAWLIVSVLNGLFALVVGLQVLPARPATWERKNTMIALFMNLALPGAGVDHALAGRRDLGGLPGWEWGFINMLACLIFVIAGANYVILALLSGLVGFAAAVYNNTQPTLRKAES